MSVLWPERERGASDDTATHLCQFGRATVRLVVIPCSLAAVYYARVRVWYDESVFTKRVLFVITNHVERGVLGFSQVIHLRNDPLRRSEKNTALACQGSRHLSVLNCAGAKHSKILPFWRIILCIHKICRSVRQIKYVHPRTSRTCVPLVARPCAGWMLLILPTPTHAQLSHSALQRRAGNVQRVHKGDILHCAKLLGRRRARSIVTALCAVPLRWTTEEGVWVYVFLFVCFGWVDATVDRFGVVVGNDAVRCFFLLNRCVRCACKLRVV